MFHCVSDMIEQCKGNRICTYLYNNQSCSSGGSKVTNCQQRTGMLEHSCSDQKNRSEGGNMAMSTNSAVWSKMQHELTDKVNVKYLFVPDHPLSCTYAL
jgi:hypothetical protein